MKRFNIILTVVVVLSLTGCASWRQFGYGESAMSPANREVAPVLKPASAKKTNSQAREYYPIPEIVHRNNGRKG